MRSVTTLCGWGLPVVISLFWVNQPKPKEGQCPPNKIHHPKIGQHLERAGPNHIGWLLTSKASTKIGILIYTPPLCFLNILTSTLSRNSVQVIFISCMNRAIEKCANRLLKTHKIKVVFFPLYLKRMTFTIYPQTFFLIFLHRFVLFCFISFCFFSVAPFSHKRSASIKIPFLQKLFGASNNLGVHPFPSPIDHFGVLTSPYRLKKGVLDI